MLSLFNKPKPVKKSGLKRLDKKVATALKKSGGKCVTCRKRKRKGMSLFCGKCMPMGSLFGKIFG